ncbi:MAG: hypothetical protein ABL874_01200 [Sphingopyxis sp.]
MAIPIRHTPRSFLGKPFSLAPNMDARRNSFERMFIEKDENIVLVHKSRAYPLTSKQYLRCIEKFDDILSEVQGRFRIFIIETFVASLIVIPSYFHFKDQLLGMLSPFWHSYADLVIIAQPILWAVWLAAWQERKIDCLVAKLMAGITKRSGAPAEKIDTPGESYWGSILVQTVVVAMVALFLFGWPFG